MFRRQGSHPARIRRQTVVLSIPARCAASPQVSHLSGSPSMNVAPGGHSSYLGTHIEARTASMNSIGPPLSEFSPSSPPRTRNDHIASTMKAWARTLP